MDTIELQIDVFIGPELKPTDLYSRKIAKPLKSIKWYTKHCRNSERVSEYNVRLIV